MARRKSNKTPASGFDDPQVSTKRWLRPILMQAIGYWVPVLRLEAFVDQITLYIADEDDPDIGENSGARIVIDSIRRSADVRVKRNVVAVMKGEYVDTHYTPEETAELTLLHELVHIITHPMSQWVDSTIKGMRNHKVLLDLFTQQEEIGVEHLTRAFYNLKSQIQPDKRFSGTIKYLANDPTNRIEDLPV